MVFKLIVRIMNGPLMVQRCLLKAKILSEGGTFTIQVGRWVIYLLPSEIVHSMVLCKGRLFIGVVRNKGCHLKLKSIRFLSRCGRIWVIAFIRGIH